MDHLENWAFFFYFKMELRLIIAQFSFTTIVCGVKLYQDNVKFHFKIGKKSLILKVPQNSKVPHFPLMG